MKKLAFLMLAAGLITMLVTSCKKDEEKPGQIPGGSFTIDAISYNVDRASWDISNGLIFSNNSANNIEHRVRITIDSLNYPTYTYNSRNSGTYDPKKNFTTAEVRYNPTNIDGAGKEITGASAGTINVKREGDKYTIEYNITVEGKEVKGLYYGQISM